MDRRPESVPPGNENKEQTWTRSQRLPCPGSFSRFSQHLLSFRVSDGRTPFFPKPTVLQPVKCRRVPYSFIIHDTASFTISQDLHVSLHSFAGSCSNGMSGGRPPQGTKGTFQIRLLQRTLDQQSSRRLLSARISGPPREFWKVMVPGLSWRFIRSSASSR